MVSNIPSFRQMPKDNVSGGRGGSERVRAPNPARPGQFRRAMRDDKRFNKEDKPRETEKIREVEEVDDSEENPSLFELSRTRAKKKAAKDAFDAELAAKEASQDPEAEVTAPLVEEGVEITDGLNLEDFYANMDGFAPEEMPKPQTPILTTVKPPDQMMDALKIQQATLASSKQVPKIEKKYAKSTDQSISKKQKASPKSPSERTAEVKGDSAGAANASIQAVNFQTDKVQESKEVAPPSTIRELATQIIDRIQIMRKDNETHTTITLRNPPILEGATITLTTSSHASREFNIAFANLSPDAKLLLDRKLSEDSLTGALARKGIVVHMLTTSTNPAENLMTAEAGQTSRERQQDQQRQQQQQQQREQSSQDLEDEEGVT